MPLNKETNRQFFIIGLVYKLTKVKIKKKKQ